MTITEFIKADLKERIASGRGLPGKLTLTALSDHYAVSPTPVRQAVNDLIDERYLLKQPNGRLTPGAQWNKSSPKRAGKKPRKQRDAHSNRTLVAVQPPADATSELSNLHSKKITAEVIRRSLTGESGFLREQAAAEEFCVGRSVIRRVFSTLAGRGLIEHIPRCGWRIRAYREADMLQYLDVRESLELKALDLAWGKLESKQLDLFLKGNSRAAVKLQKIDNRLHQYWIDRSENRYLIDFFGRHGGYFSALFDQAAMTDHVIRQAASEHRSILGAIEKGDRRLAKKRLALHIRGQRPKVSRMYELLHALS